VEVPQAQAERAVNLTVLHRLMVSGSDRDANSWRETAEVPGVDALTLDHAYKVMAWLGEDVTGAGVTQHRSRTDEIEEALYAHRRSLFGEHANQARLGAWQLARADFSRMTVKNFLPGKVDSLAHDSTIQLRPQVAVARLARVKSDVRALWRVRPLARDHMAPPKSFCAMSRLDHAAEA